MSERALDVLHPRADYGEPEAEYRAFLDSCALVQLSDQAAVRVTGERRLEMLDGLLSNKLRDLESAARHALLLTAKGRVLTDLKAVARSEDLLLLVPRGGLENLLGAFRKYLPPIFAQFDEVSESVRQFGLYGPKAAAVARSAFGDAVPEDDLGAVELTFAGLRLALVRDRFLAGDGVEVIAPVGATAELVARLAHAAGEAGGRAAGERALEIARVEWGVPRYSVDMSEDNLAQETGLEGRAISHDKGCYLGQEVVARIHFRGHVNRHLRGLKFRGARPAGVARLVEAGKEVGFVTRSVESPELGPIGLAYVRRQIEPANQVRWIGAEREGMAEVIELPFRERSV